VRLHDPSELDQLLLELGLQPDLIVTQVEEGVIELDLLGSYEVEEMKHELERRLAECAPRHGFVID
jgi:hypothetical protein